MRETPKELQVYRHFKGALYQIVTIAIHTETSEQLVIYRSLTHPDRVFARPVAMFLSEVNHKKYPDVKAKYRFTLLDENDTENQDKIEAGESVESVLKFDAKESIEQNDYSDEDTGSALKETEIKDDLVTDDNRKYRDDGTLVIDPWVEKILDSKEYTDKIEAFERLRGKCTDDMLSTLAMALDIQLDGETIEEKYADVLRCLKMRQKYETSRLR